MARWLHGWSIFLSLLRSQRRKKHGVGKRALIPAIYFAQCGRWIVDGQHRNAAHPNLAVYNMLARACRGRT